MTVTFIPGTTELRLRGGRVITQEQLNPELYKQLVVDNPYLQQFFVVTETSEENGEENNGGDDEEPSGSV